MERAWSYFTKPAMFYEDIATGFGVILLPQFFVIPDKQYNITYLRIHLFNW